DLDHLVLLADGPTADNAALGLDAEYIWLLLNGCGQVRRGRVRIDLHIGLRGHVGAIRQTAFELAGGNVNSGEANDPNRDADDREQRACFSTGDVTQDFFS